MKSLQPLNVLLLALITLISGSSFGQNKVDIAAGAGFPELVNLGLRFQLGQAQLGFYGGKFPGSPNNLFTLGADLYFHVGGTSDLSVRKPWYGKAGLNYFHDEDEYLRKTTFFLVPRVGRDFNLSRRIGIALEGGAFLLISHTEVEIKPRQSPCWLCEGGFVSVGPSLGLSLFYRL